jgi:hypothetical protein
MSMRGKDKVYNRRSQAGAGYGSKAADKAIDSLDSGALCFDLVYNQNGSSSQLGRPRDKMGSLYVENGLMKKPAVIKTGR